MYKISLYKNCDSNDLIKYGFKKCGSNYKLNIPLYKYKNIPVISVNFIISDSYDYIGYDVIDCNSGELYIHFYNREYSNSKSNIVLKKVIKELNRLFDKMKNEKIISDYEEIKPDE